MHSTREEGFEPYPGGGQDVKATLDEAVAGVPTVFGKLVWVSSLRVPDSDQYRYPGLEHVSREAVSSALRELHKIVFGAWLGLVLQEQSKDFAEYLEAFRLSGNPAETLLPETREKLIPPDAKEAERCLFDNDLSLVLELAERRDT